MISSREFVPDGTLVIDVGANIGFFSLRFAEWVGDGGKVIAIEPEDQKYELISALKRAGLGDRVHALKDVAAAEPGMAISKSTRCNRPKTSFGNGTGLPVTAVIDRLVQDKGPLRPALVKINVQGAEMLTFEGMTQFEN